MPAASASDTGNIALMHAPPGNVYDDGCNVADELLTNGNPCDSGTFGCSPPPVIFNRYTNTFTHLV